MTTSGPIPPPDLSDAAVEFWRRIVEDWDEWEVHHELLLGQALRQWDLAREARGLWKDAGMMISDPSPRSPDRVKPHPALAIENKATTQVRLIFRELGLDFEDPNDNRPAKGS